MENQTNEGNLPEQLRLAMRFWASGVSIVSAHFDGVDHGMTVSSFTSLSITPPLVMVSLAQNSRTHALVDKSGGFVVSILAEDQQSLSDQFAGRIPDSEDRFEGVASFHLKSNARAISGALANLECKVVNSMAVGTHTLYVGEVLEAHIFESGADQAPLLYYNQAYKKLR